MNDNEQDSVEFGNKMSAVPGAISGAAIAIGVPAVTLIWGRGLTGDVQVVMLVLGVAVGGLIALTATFFSLVIPSSVKGHGRRGCSCNCGESENTKSAEKLL